MMKSDNMEQKLEEPLLKVSFFTCTIILCDIFSQLIEGIVAWDKCSLSIFQSVLNFHQNNRAKTIL